MIIEFMNKQKGFTLIEMVVVITVIGFLAAAVLAAIGPVRKKARDSRVQALVQEASAIIESFYNPTTGLYNKTDLIVSQSWSDIKTQIEGQGGSGFDTKVDKNVFAVFAAVPSKDGVYCVDSEGRALLMKVAPVGAACA